MTANEPFDLPASVEPAVVTEILHRVIRELEARNRELRGLLREAADGVRGQLHGDWSWRVQEVLARQEDSPWQR